MQVTARWQMPIMYSRRDKVLLATLYNYNNAHQAQTLHGVKPLVSMQGLRSNDHC